MWMHADKIDFPAMVVMALRQLAEEVSMEVSVGASGTLVAPRLRAQGLQLPDRWM